MSVEEEEELYLEIMNGDEEEEMSATEAENILKAIKALKLKPKADTPEDFKHWMEAVVASGGTGPDTNPSSTTSGNKSPGTSATPSQYHGFPRISNFSGAPKSETSYELWKYEIQCLQADTIHKEEQILQAIRRSLKGEAAHVVMRLGTKATINDILHKMDSIYDTVESKESLLGQFYSAKQEESESVSAWGCRLEEVINKAVSRGEVQKQATDGMLRHVFWNGLKPSLKDVSGYIFDKKATFDELRSAIRVIEQEHDLRKPSKPTKKDQNTGSVNMATHDDIRPALDELRGMVQQLSSDVALMQNSGYRGGYSNQRGRGYYGGRSFRGRGSHNRQYDNSGSRPSVYQPPVDHAAAQQPQQQHFSNQQQQQGAYREPCIQPAV